MIRRNKRILRQKSIAVIVIMTMILSCFSSFPIYSFADTDEGQKNATVDFSTNQLIVSDTPDYKIVIKDEEGVEYNSDPTGKIFNLPIRKGDSYYTYEFVPDDTDKYIGSKGKFWVYGDLNWGGLNLSDNGRGFYVSEKKTFDIDVPTGADVKFYSRVKFYRPLECIEGEKISSDGSYDKYRFIIPDPTGKANKFFEVTQPGKVKWDGFLKEMTSVSQGEIPVYKVEALKENNKQILRDESQSFYEAGLITNGNSSKYLELKADEYFDIYAFRAWQAINSITDNDYVDPVFNYSVVEGDSVTVNDEGRITAVKDGVSIVKVDYDALEWQNSSDRSRMVYSACWPEKAGFYVVNVNGEKSDTLNTGIDLSEYDTIYYAENQDGIPTGTDSAPYTFKPTSTNNDEIQVYVKNPVISGNDVTFTDWIDSNSNKDKSFTVNLKKGRNIVKVKCGNVEKYHVIAADGLDINITNKYRPGNKLVPGDVAAIRLTGLTTPIPKMGAIYNPAGYSIHYNLGEASVGGALGQYNISQNAEFLIDINESGVYEFKNGHLNTSVWGSDAAGDIPLMHQRMTKGGNIANNEYNGADNPLNDAGNLCVLPDITFEVEDSNDAEEIEKQNAGLLKELVVYRGNYAIHTIDEETLKTQNNTNLRTSALSYKRRNEIISVKAVPKDPNAKVYVRYYNSNGFNGSEIIEDNKNVQIGTTTDFVAELKNHPANIPVSLDKAYDGFIEVIVVPESGYSNTYTFRTILNKPNVVWSFAYPLTDFKITPVDTTFSIFEGAFHSPDIKIGNETINRGRKYIQTAFDYVVDIPYRVDKIKASADLTDAEGNKYPKDSVITLKTGNNNYTYTAKAKNTEDTKVYTFNFKREAGGTVTFENAENTAIIVKDDNNKKYEVKENQCNLADGTYKAYIEKEGYITEVKDLKINGENVAIDCSKLKKAPDQKGTVNVNIAGYDSNIKEESSLKITKPQNLKKERYVEYNHGGYTALHAIINTLNSGDKKVSFSCKNGNLKINNVNYPEDAGVNAGWICEINGKVCKEPANTMVNSGDNIKFYYNPDYEGMLTAEFDGNAVQRVKKGENISLTLFAKPTGTDGNKVAVKDAEILIRGEKSGLKTDANGKVTIPAEKLPLLGDYYITAEKQNVDGKNILTYSQLLLKVYKPANPKPDTGGKINVTFSLLGDKIHDSDEDGDVHTLIGGGLESWIDNETYNIDNNITVGDLLRIVEKKHTNIKFNNTGNYINTVEYNGIKLSEFTNGTKSGWMYTLNGKHPSLGVEQQKLSDGDEIVFHYTDDYTIDDPFVEPADAAKEVDNLISAIGKVTLEKEKQIEDARAAYEGLSIEAQKKVTKLKVLEDAEKALAKLKKPVKPVDPVKPEDKTKEYKKAYNEVGSFYADNLLGFGEEWPVIGLTRGGYPIDKAVYDRYYQSVLQKVKSVKGELHRSKYTEYSRTILALTAAGYDPTNVGGYNLVAKLGDFNKVKAQGPNGSIWALIALDSNKYELSKDATTTRDKLIAEILANEISGGGWSMDPSKADVDMTGMAIQALAPYYKTNAEVKAAVDRGLTWLSSKMSPNGAFREYGGKESVESTAQVVVALTALGIDPVKDDRFVKSGKNALDGLMMFYVGNGRFEHLKNTGANGIATEQGFYALASYLRFAAGKTALYDMTDLTKAENPKEAETVLPIVGPNGNATVVTDKESVKIAPSEIKNLTNELTVKLADKTVKYDKKAMDAIKKQIPADAKNVEIVLEKVEKGYNNKQAGTIKDSKALGVFSIKLVVTEADGEMFEIHDFNGGKATITVPFANPKNLKLEVHRVENDGKITLMNSTYSEGILSWVTDGHSYYMVTEAGTAKVATAKTTPKTGDTNNMIPWSVLLLGAAGAVTLIRRKKNSNYN